MKFIIACLLASASAVQLSGIDPDDLMQEQPSHWRKEWPQGSIDNADGDAEVLDKFNHPEKKKPKKKEVTYPWSLDEDVTSTQDSIKKAEGLTGKQLSQEGVRDGGMDMIFKYDNTKVQFERNTPYGSTWEGQKGSE